MMRRNLLLGVLVVLLVGTLTGLGLVLTRSGSTGPSSALTQVATTPTATPTPSATPVPTASPTASPTPSPTAAATASTSSTAQPTRSATAVATVAAPKPTPTSGSQAIGVVLSGPLTATVGQPLSYAVQVTWSQQRDDTFSLRFGPALPRTDGCGAKQTAPPSPHGPGARTVRQTHTFDQPGTFQVVAVAGVYCGYYKGEAADELTVVVSAAPTPSPQPS